MVRIEQNITLYFSPTSICKNYSPKWKISSSMKLITKFIEPNMCMEYFCTIHWEIKILFRSILVTTSIIVSLFLPPKYICLDHTTGSISKFTCMAFCASTSVILVSFFLLSKCHNKGRGRSWFSLCKNFSHKLFTYYPVRYMTMGVCVSVCTYGCVYDSLHLSEMVLLVSRVNKKK